MFEFSCVALFEGLLAGFALSIPLGQYLIGSYSHLLVVLLYFTCSLYMKFGVVDELPVLHVLVPVLNAKTAKPSVLFCKAAVFAIALFVPARVAPAFLVFALNWIALGVDSLAREVSLERSVSVQPVSTNADAAAIRNNVFFIFFKKFEKTKKACNHPQLVSALGYRQVALYTYKC